MAKNNVYIVEMCKSDGTTPPGKVVKLEISAKGYNEARLKAYKAHPKHDIVSYGRKDDTLSTRKFKNYD